MSFTIAKLGVFSLGGGCPWCLLDSATKINFEEEEEALVLFGQSLVSCHGLAPAPWLRAQWMRGGGWLSSSLLPCAPIFPSLHFTSSCIKRCIIWIAKCFYDIKITFALRWTIFYFAEENNLIELNWRLSVGSHSNGLRFPKARCTVPQEAPALEVPEAMCLWQSTWMVQNMMPSEMFIENWILKENGMGRISIGIRIRMMGSG